MRLANTVLLCTICAFNSPRYHQYVLNFIVNVFEDVMDALFGRFQIWKPVERKLEFSKPTAFCVSLLQTLSHK